MKELVEYVENLNWLSLIDLLFIIILMSAILSFFFRKKDYKLGILFVIYLLAFVVLDFCIGYFNIKWLYFTHGIFVFMGIFIIMSCVVVYQSDLKQLFSRFGGKNATNPYAKLHVTYNEDDLRFASKEIVKACQCLSKENVGALIVVCPTIIDSNTLDTGIRLNAVLSAPLLVSIFNTHAPLHDGAVIIKNNMVLAAGCFLPLSQNPSISKDLGTRHRAAVGITEESDVLTIVVSEETGIISLVQNGEIRRYITGEKLLEALEEAFGITNISRRRNRIFGRGNKNR